MWSSGSLDEFPALKTRECRHLSRTGRGDFHFLIRDILLKISSLDFTTEKNEFPELLIVLIWDLTSFIFHFSLQFLVILIPVT